LRVENNARSPGAVEAELPATAVRFATADGCLLGGSLFEGSGTGPLVLISSATAVPHRLYARFAAMLVASGARAVLTYDYRGTGSSPRLGNWSQRIDYKDWALQDFPAAVRFLDSVAPSHAMVGVGQSFGGQALGLSGMSDRFQRYAMVATMSGYWRLLDDPTVWARMNLVGVPVSLLYRDLPRWLGIGEPMPSSCFRDWARWCRMTNYFFDDPSLPETARFNDVRLPILAVGLTDDHWATPRAVDDFMRHYTNAQVTQRWITPGQAGADSIGHLGFFRSKFADTLWPQLGAWLIDGTPMTIGDATAPTRI
jgi:predicted alpha/beta hydrolase